MKKAKLILVIFVISLSSCENKLDLSNPNDRTSETFWETQMDFEKAVISVYTPLKNWNGGYYGTRGVMTRISRADEVIFRNDINEIYNMHRFTNDNFNAVAQNLFYQFYNGIYRSNLILQEIENKDFAQEFTDKVKGQVYFLRGLFYFQLAKEFRDVPIRLTASQDLTEFPLPKSPQSEVYAQAESDFLAAINLLEISDYPGKPTKGAASAFLGKLYVYTEQWGKAKNVLEPLTTAPYDYRLVENYFWNFDEAHEYNSESIFEILYEPVGGTNQWDNGETANSAQSTTISVEYAAGSVGGWYEANPSDKMINIFSEEKKPDGDFDDRMKLSVVWDYPGAMYYMKPIQEVLNESELEKYWILKYQNSDTRTLEGGAEPSYINQRAMRFANVILFLAECEIELGNPTEAIPYINKIRARGGLSPYAGPNSTSALKQELIHQRAIEFFKEGERFYDLRRWGLLESELQKQDPIRFSNFEDSNYYLPIPAKEIQTNPEINQNNGSN